MLGGKSMLWEKIEQGTSGRDGRPCGLHSGLCVKEIKISILTLWGSCSLAEPKLLSWLLLKIWQELKCMLVSLRSSLQHPFPLYHLPWTHFPQWLAQRRRNEMCPIPRPPETVVTGSWDSSWQVTVLLPLQWDSWMPALGFKWGAARSSHRGAIDWRFCGQHGARGSSVATGNSFSSDHGFL